MVGPVRTGKSTFIKRFMDLFVIPNIENVHSKERAKDELPQSAAGKTIMTTEPKFVPNEAVNILLEDEINFKVRLIDCVGYLVPGANGHLEDELPRMVSTPWFENKIPFAEAAEFGTRKVINEHSTIGIVITTDGSITDIGRDDYIEAETRVIDELKALNKPFVIVLNSTQPYAPETESLRDDLAKLHKVPVTTVNCAQIKADDINKILESMLYEFPAVEVNFNFPKWIETLPLTHWVKQSMLKSVKEMAKDIDRLREIKNSLFALDDNEFIKKSYINKINLGSGSAEIEINLDESLFYKVLSETTGMQIDGEYQLISMIKVLAQAKKEYDKIKFALEEVKHKGYGIVTPSMDEMRLEAPQIVKHGSRYGVKLKASAPSLHIIQANIETEISPIVGTQQQSEELIEYFSNEMKDDPTKIWELNMFGKSMHDMVKDGLQSKLHRMPEDAQFKLQEGLQKIVNDGNGRLICILL